MNGIVGVKFARPAIPCSVCFRPETRQRLPTPGLEPCTQNYKLHVNPYMHDFLKLHHNCDAYMDVQKERQSTFLTAFEHREKEARSLFAAQYWYRSGL